MKTVWPGVDPALLMRTADWLRSKGDGKGGFREAGVGLHRFGLASAEVTGAYVTWALVESGHGGGIAGEIEAQHTRAQRSDNPYVVALAANTLFAAKRTDDGLAAIERLVTLQRRTARGWAPSRPSRAVPARTSRSRRRRWPYSR